MNKHSHSGANEKTHSNANTHTHISTKMSAGVLTKTAICQLKQYIIDQKPIVVALSGGIDSVVLLHSLKYECAAWFKNTRSELSAVHIHHGLNENANAWLDFCQAFCQQHNIPFQFKKVLLKPHNRQGIEAVARQARYQALTQLSPNNAVIATAQHLNDQVETFFLRLKRGSGLTGLSGMKSQSALTEFDPKKILWRPFLEHPKNSLLAYASAHQLSWVEDDSNLNDDFDRNFLRNQIIPLLDKRWQGFSQCVSRSVQLCQQDQEIVQQVAESDLTQAIFKPLSVVQASEQVKTKTNKTLTGNVITNNALILDVNQLISLSTARLNNVLRRWLSMFNEPMPSLNVLQQIHTNFKANLDRQPKIKLALGEIWQYKTQLYYHTYSEIALLAQIPDNVCLPTQQDGVEFSKVFNRISVNNQKNLVQLDLSGLLSSFSPETKPVGGLSSNIVTSLIRRAPLITEKAEIRFNISGKTTCRPINRNCTKTVKQLLKESQVAPWRRPHIPYLFYNDQLVAAIGYWVCEIVDNGYDSYQSDYLADPNWRS